MVNGTVNVVTGAITSRWKGSNERNDDGENKGKHGLRMERTVFERQLRYEVARLQESYTFSRVLESGRNYIRLITDMGGRFTAELQKPDQWRR